MEGSSIWCEFLEAETCAKEECITIAAQHTIATSSNMKRRLIDPRRQDPRTQRMFQQYQDIAQSWIESSIEKVDCEWRDRYYQELSALPPTVDPKPAVVHEEEEDHPCNFVHSYDRSHMQKTKLPWSKSFHGKFDNLENDTIDETESGVNMTLCDSRSSPDTVFDFPLLNYKDDDGIGKLSVPDTPKPLLPLPALDLEPLEERPQCIPSLLESETMTENLVVADADSAVLSLDDTPKFLLSLPASVQEASEWFSPMVVSETITPIFANTTSATTVQESPTLHDSFSFFLDITSSRYYPLYSPVRN